MKLAQRHPRAFGSKRQKRRQIWVLDGRYGQDRALGYEVHHTRASARRALKLVGPMFGMRRIVRFIESSKP